MPSYGSNNEARKCENHWVANQELQSFVGRCFVNRFLSIVLGLSLAEALIACKSETILIPSTYVASLSVGDLVEIAFGPDDKEFTVNCTVTDTAGASASAFSYKASCTSKDTRFDYRVCTVLEVTPVQTAPKAGDEFYVLSVPGVGFVMHNKSMPTMHMLHAGVARGTCGDPSGTYNAVRFSPTGQLEDLFSQYKVVGQGSGALTSVDRWDFGLVVNGQESTNQNSDPARALLASGTAEAHPAAMGSSSCANGISTSTFDGGVTVRSNLNSSGAIVFDLQSGKGGLIGVKSSSSASLADLRGKSYSVMTYELGEAVNIASVTIGNDDAVTITGDLNGTLAPDGGVLRGTLAPISASALAGTFGDAGLVDRETVLSDGGVVTYGAPAGGRAAAPVPSSMEGLYAITFGNALGTASGTGRSTLVMAHKAASGTIFLVGAHFGVNNATWGTTKCFQGGANASSRQLYCNDGPFIGFSR
jgi:hypothetical protein